MPERIPVIIMIQGRDPGTRWRLEQTRVTTVGRSRRNQIQLEHPSVSRFHCEISYINGLWYVADLNSKKGTYINGRKITDREVMKPGDVIRVCKNVFKFDLINEGEQQGSRREIQEINRSEEVNVPDILEQQQSTGDLALDIDWEAILHNAAERAAYILLVGLLIGGIALGTILYGHYRVRKMKLAHEATVRKRENALEKATAPLRRDPPRLKEALERLSGVIEEFEETPQAEAAAEKYHKVERRFFNDRMQEIQSMIEERNYRAANAEFEETMHNIRASHIHSVAEPHGRFINRLGETAFEQMKKRTSAELKDHDLTDAIQIVEDNYEKLAVNEDMLAKGEEILRELKETKEKSDSYEEGANTDDVDQDIEERFGPVESLQ
ncbi:MAG: FHA domain-containing protein [Planctomycetota bacterium]